jgi:hypothetical protein
MEIAFAEMPLRKIYFEATAESAQQYSRGLVEIASVEGVLKEHQWDGRWFADVVIASVDRSAFYSCELRNRLIKHGRLRPVVVDSKQSSNGNQDDCG